MATYQAADQACEPLLPTRDVSQPLSPAEQQAWLAWASCVRSHGVPDFADPTFTNGGVTVHAAVPAGQGQSQSEQMQAARTACKPKMPASGGDG